MNAVAASLALALEVLGPGYSYMLTVDKASLAFRGDGQVTRLKIEPCNRDAVAELTRDARRRALESPRLPASLRGPNALEVRSKNAKIFLAPGSAHGLWLRALPSRVLKLVVKADHLCSGSR